MYTFDFISIRVYPHPHENVRKWGGRAHSDANKILQRHDIDKSRVSFERRIV